MKSTIANFFIDLKIKKLFRSLNILSEAFDTRGLEREISEVSGRIYSQNKKRFLSPIETTDNAIGLVATELYDSGGHTPCFINLVQSFYTEYRVECFLLKKEKTIHHSCKNKITTISNIVTLSGINQHRYKFSLAAIELYNQIVLSGVKVILLLIHQNDFTTVLALNWIKRFTKIRVIFFNLADHQPSIGMKAADTILDFRPAGFELTRTSRQYTKNILIDLQSTAKEKIIFFNQEDISLQRKNWGILDNEVTSLTGCNAIKLFDGDSSSYFEMILELLQKHPNLKHVVISRFNEHQTKIIEKIFSHFPKLRSRLILAPYQSNFDLLLQAADLFIDSFPQGSALTHVDCMRNKLPTVIKINKDDPFKSFEFYLPKNYHYKSESIEEMKNLIGELIDNPSKRERISKELYQYFLGRFERGITKPRYKEIIENQLSIYENSPSN